MEGDWKHGLLLVDKEAGGTSHDVVQRARRLLREKKIGHCGTLDPAATGLLVLTVGRATRLTRFLIRAPKSYSGVARFGAATDTYDAAGTVTSEAPIEDLAEEAILEAMTTFEGTYDQLAPPYSAKKVQGKKLYELAREGKEVPRESKEVDIYSFSATSPYADGELAFEMSCSSGTYARSLVHDLGEKLGCGAHLSALRRLAVGHFQLEDAATLEVLAERIEETDELGKAWIPFDRIPLPFSEVTADPQQERRIFHGQTVLMRELGGEEGDWVKLINQRQEFIAVGTVVERIGNAGVGLVQPRVVFKAS